MVGRAGVEAFVVELSCGSRTMVPFDLDGPGPRLD
jgi:hypothetical protein